MNAGALSAQAGLDDGGRPARGAFEAFRVNASRKLGRIAEVWIVDINVLRKNPVSIRPRTRFAVSPLLHPDPA